MNNKTIINSLLFLFIYFLGTQVQAAGYLKIGDIKGESSRDEQPQPNQVMQVRQPTGNQPQPASMTPEQAEELRKQIKEALKPPCPLNSNKPCPPPCGMNSNC